ncbi:hypothetical protein CMUS01_02102 [Colletotrichum musicola]|uniref:Uncharacterized protein n=1 Tax=Colletotrichum musicola TaxID=2175873 RepID=A0A8H6NVS3_9PEZI|nr:hypothetical protein CMUS01_02102 [Colletotrichum musicola]
MIANFPAAHHHGHANATEAKSTSGSCSSRTDRASRQPPPPLPPIIPRNPTRHFTEATAPSPASHRANHNRSLQKRGSEMPPATTATASLGWFSLSIRSASGLKISPPLPHASVYLVHARRGSSFEHNARLTPTRKPSPEREHHEARGH